MSRQRELNLIFSKCAYFFFFEKHYFSSRYTSISIEFGKLSERIQHQRRWWCVFWMQCPSQSKTIQNFLEIQCKYKTIFFKKKSISLPGFIFLNFKNITLLVQKINTMNMYPPIYFIPSTLSLVMHSHSKAVFKPIEMNFRKIHFCIPYRKLLWSPIPLPELL